MKGYVKIFNSLIIALLMTSMVGCSKKGGTASPAAANSSGPQTVDAAQEKKMKHKMAIRDFIMGQADDSMAQNAGDSALSVKIAISGNDLPEHLVDNAADMVRSLQKMEDMKLLAAKLDQKPWSDDYWAIYKGILGYRFADDGGMGTVDYTWKAHFDFFTANPATDYVSQNKTHLLSPSEKYELIIGETEASLTKKMWSEGESYLNDKGEVETWMGICHGWAAAAFMVNRPTKAITVKSFDGLTDVLFYPADMKALASQLWAKTPGRTKFIGGRCNVKDVKVDDTGRIVEPECFDTNPGAWHLSVVNQIGISRRSLVLDATYDYEVWNFPLYSYSYNYANLLTHKTSDLLSENVINLADYVNDPYAKHRNPKATKVVGIMMKIVYMVETAPTTKLTDSEERDRSSSRTYRYDLELDDELNIVGGEWHDKHHPDFLWTPVKDSKGKTRYEHLATGIYEPSKSVMNESWSKVAKDAAKKGQVISKIVDALIEESNRKVEPVIPPVVLPTETVTE
jgi:hypothetical protein